MDVFSTAYGLAQKAQIPLSIHFDLTYRCHQRCVHCFLPEDWRRGQGPGPELTTAQVESILEKLAAMGVFFLTFSGGEIFLRPDLINLVKYARRLNFSISLISSGTIGPHEEQIKLLADLGIAGLLLSLHGMEARWHEQVTGVPGSWNQVHKTIKAGRAQGLLVVLNSMALRHNLEGVAALRDYAAREDLPLRLDDQLLPR